MTMIASGGIIGAGLFVGTGPILNQAGPATVLTYLLTGTILILLLTATNLYSVGSYGEFEFWCGGIKVAAIVIFIALAILFVIGLLPGGGVGLSNLYDEGGFFPNGDLVMFSGVATVIFAFVGAEIVTIAAAESNEPERGKARATNQVIYRVLLFYVVSVFFLAVAVIPEQRPLLIASVISAVVILVAYLLRRQFGPPEKSPDEVAER
jgi:L-asparagine transporter-like permease